MEVLLPLLQDPRASVRRNAAAALGHLGRPRATGALAAAESVERSEEARLQLAVARVRCGADPDAVRDGLSAFERRRLQTCHGPKSVHGAVGVSDLLARHVLTLGDEGVEPRATLLARRRALVSTEAEGKQGHAALLALASLRHPADHARIADLLRSAGRRGEHAVLTAFGLAGDPRSVPALRDALYATDVDPGRGFAQRRLAAIALGQVGLGETLPLLLSALENEARDYEGRPGAGMGVQFPVRTNLLWAVGEVGDVAAAPTLATYLGDVHGSAFGGFYLPAMDALVKLGPGAHGAVRRVLETGPAPAAANALGVLVAGGVDPHPWTSDRRPELAALARRALEAA